MNKLKIAITLPFVFLLLSCNSTNEPKPEPKDGYVTLDVGDIRQFYISPDNCYMMVEVTGKASRTDGKEVFQVVESFQFPDGIYSANTNYFIEDGYFWRTLLDTTTNENLEHINPFKQEKLAMVWPIDGERFQIKEGAEEENMLFMQVGMIDIFETPIQSFSDVAEYSQYNNLIDTHFKSFFANSYGHIGTYYSNGIDTSIVKLCYIKANFIEEGNYVHLYSNRLDIKTFNSKGVFSKFFYDYLTVKPTSWNEYF